MQHTSCLHNVINVMGEQLYGPVVYPESCCKQTEGIFNYPAGPWEPVVEDAFRIV